MPSLEPQIACHGHDTNRNKIKGWGQDGDKKGSEQRQANCCGHHKAHLMSQKHCWLHCEKTDVLFRHLHIKFLRSLFLLAKSWQPDIRFWFGSLEMHKSMFKIWSLDFRISYQDSANPSQLISKNLLSSSPFSDPSQSPQTPHPPVVLPDPQQALSEILSSE